MLPEGGRAGAETKPKEATAIAGASNPRAEHPLVVRWLQAFGAFWWDFLIGDTPELFVGALVVIGVVALLAKAWSVNAAAVTALPVLVVALLAASVARASRSKH
jgi:hypothetical protein